MEPSKELLKAERLIAVELECALWDDTGASLGRILREIIGSFVITPNARRSIRRSLLTTLRDHRASWEAAEREPKRTREQRDVSSAVNDEIAAISDGLYDYIVRAERVVLNLETRAEAAERELHDCDAARTLVLSENERLANELMAMRAGRKAEIEALRAKAELAGEVYKETIAIEEANLPLNFRAAAIRENMLRWLNRFDALTTPAPAKTEAEE